jgi:SAM-dependent methyltransferase
MLPDALREHWRTLEAALKDSSAELLRHLQEGRPQLNSGYDERTRANFSHEWEFHEIGDRTWGMNLEDRIKWYFLDTIGLPKDQLAGKIMLDAGCGNGSQSVGYTQFGLEVVALDLSSGLEHGHVFRHRYPKARARSVHFVQADLQRPPLKAHCFDIIHSVGVLHHTPNTKKTFDTLCPLLREGGRFYVALYKYEPFVTPLVNTIRAVTTRIPSPLFTRIAKLMAVPFQVFRSAVSALGIRKYSRASRREAALALMDIFGAPYAHYHSFTEVKQWYDAHGFEETWKCGDYRRDFGVCGSKPHAKHVSVSPAGEGSLSTTLIN